MTDTTLAARIRALAGNPELPGCCEAFDALPALADLVEAVTLRHWPQDGRDCAECGDEWPCPTAAALDALAAALGVAQ